MVIGGEESRVLPLLLILWGYKRETCKRLVFMMFFYCF